MKRTAGRKTVRERLTEAMGELEQAMRGDRPLDHLFTIRTVRITDPSTYDAASVRRTRSRLQVSQALFSQLLGVSSELVEHWEQGICPPRGAARRLLDEINRDPTGFLQRHIAPPGRRFRKAG